MMTTGEKDKIRRIGDIFRRKARKAPTHQALVLATRTYEKLLEQGLGWADALDVLCKWFGPLARRRSPRELQDGAMAIVGPLRQTMGMHDGHVAVAVGCAIAGLQNGYHKKSRAEAAEMLVMLTSTIVSTSNASLRLRRRVIELALEISRYVESEEVRVPAAHLIHWHAELLSQEAGPEYVDFAIEEFRRALGALNALVEEGAEGADVAYAQCLNNFAQTLSECLHGDAVSNLREAIELFDACLALPARNSDDGAFGLTVQSRVAAVNKLVPLLDDADEEIELLRGAVSLAEKGLERVRRGNTLSDYNLEYIREILWLASVNAQSLLLQAEERAGLRDEQETRRLLEEHCSRALEHLDEYGHVLGHVAAELRVRLLDLAGMGGASVSTEELSQFLEAASEQIGIEQQQLSDADVGRLETMLENHDGSLLAERDWKLLGRLVDVVNPVTVGMRQAWRLFLREALLLIQQVEDHTEAAESFLLEYARKRLDVALRDVKLHHWAHVHRCIFAVRLNWLAKFLMKRTDDAAERLELLDLSGSQAFAADIGFFGQGVTGGDATELSEKVWRRDLYWARVEYDQLGFAQAVRELQSHHPEIASWFEALALVEGGIGSAESDGILREMDRTNLASRTDEVRKEIAARHAQGTREGWAPVAQSEQKSEGLSRWIAEVPQRGVFTVGNGPGRLFRCGGEDSVAMNEVFTDEGEHVEAFEQAAMAFRQQVHLFHSGQGAVTPDGRRISELPATPDEVEAWVEALRTATPVGTSDSLHKKFDEALKQLIEACEPMAKALVKLADKYDISELVLLSRGGHSYIPWEAVSVGANGEVLGDRLRVVRLETLAAGGASVVNPNKHDFSYVGLHGDSGRELLPGKYALEATGTVESGFSRDEFEQAAARAGVIRLFSHAVWRPGPSSSRVDLGSSDKSYRSADTQEAFPWYTAGEIKAVDLRGCNRVELWACESANSQDLIGAMWEFDEPTGLAAAFLMAGAKRVLGSWWKQPVAPAALICAYFSARSASSSDAFADAQLLAEATSAYRRVVQPGGTFEAGMRAHLQENLNSATDPAVLRRQAAAAGWRAAFEEMTGQPCRGHIEEIATSFLGGFAEQSVEERELQEIRSNPDAAVERWMALWRGPAAWAGWRIVARDRPSRDQVAGETDA